MDPTPKSVSKRLDRLHVKLHALSKRLKVTPLDDQDPIAHLEDQIDQVREETDDDEVARALLEEISKELASLKKDSDKVDRIIKIQARRQGMDIDSSGNVFKRGTIQTLDLTGRAKLREYLSQAKPESERERLTRIISNMGKEERDKFTGYVKRGAPKDWPRNTPYPALWKRMGGKRLHNHKGRDCFAVAEELAEMFKPLGLKYSMGDYTETVVDNTLVNKECRTFCFSAALLKALMETRLQGIPAEFIKLPVPSVYFDFSTLELSMDLGGKKLDHRGCLLTVEDSSLLVCMIHRLVGDPNTIFAFTTHLFQIPEEGIFELPLRIDLTAEDVFASFQPASGLSPDVNKATYALLELTLNALLYVNSVNADLREEWLAQNTAKKIKNAKGKRKRDLKRHLEEAGKVTRAGYYLYIPTVQLGGSDSNKTGRKIGVRYLCRGHWRHYWIGPRRGERKRINKWIAPHWKGPETADQIHEKMFIVDQPKEDSHACSH